MSVYKLNWTDRADEDLLEIVTYIAERNVGAAQRLETVILHVASRLTEHPFMYRKGRKAQTREAVVTPNYILIYRVDDDQISILNVIHARQQYP